jgi:hypothetical protein
LNVKQKLDIHAYWTVRVWRFNKDRSPSRLFEPKNWQYLCKDEENLYTNSGRDWIAAQLYTNTSAGTRGAGFGGLSENAGGAAASHTSLAGEITTGGLARKDLTDKTHTAGTNVTTLHDSWTASSAFSAVQLAGLFNAAGPPISGTMVNEKAFTATPLNIGDIIDVTITITGPSTGT